MNSLAKRVIDACEVEIGETTGVNQYDPEDNTIYINETLIARVTKRIMGRVGSSLYHEVGHAVFERMDIINCEEANELFGDFEEDYEGTWGLIKSSMYSEREGYISKYAQSHPEEDFAECFAYLMERNNRIPKTMRDKEILAKLKYVKRIISETIT